VCFAGLAPREVSWQGRKVVGISQRRTRVGARFQCALLHGWDPDPLLDVLALDDRARARARADLASVAVGVPASPEAVAVALHRRLAALGP
jgi:lipoate-protein ligase A